jgi:hypothetical protein
MVSLVGCANKTNSGESKVNNSTSEKTEEKAEEKTEVNDNDSTSEEIKITVAYATEEQLNKYKNANIFTIDEDGPALLILPKEKITDFKLSHVEHADANLSDEGELLYSTEELTPDKPLIFNFYMPDMPSIRASYKTESGIEQSCAIGESQKDGSIFLIEMGKETNDIVSDYEVTDEVYSEGSINILYPQITNLPDNNIQSKVNDLLFNDPISIINNWEDPKDLNIDLSYVVTFNGSDIFSVQYLGLAYVKDAPYPINSIYSTNISLKDGKKIALKDMIEIDTNLVQKFKNGEYRPYIDDLNLEEADALQDILSSLDDNTLIEQFKNTKMVYYFTDEALVLSAEVPHAVGDHIEMAIFYGDLGSSLKITPQ